MVSTKTELSRLYRVHPGVVEMVDVPDLGYLMVDGAGAPADPEFAVAVQALYAVSYSAHFALKKQSGTAPKVLPLEALWWVDDPGGQGPTRAGPAAVPAVDGGPVRPDPAPRAVRWWLVAPTVC